MRRKSRAVYNDWGFYIPSPCSNHYIFTCLERQRVMTTTEKKARILCVEDDPQMRTFLLAQLRARGFQAQAVPDGAQAIDVAAIFQPQLILLDLSLPTLDGLTFLRRLREWSRAPVIILSSRDEELWKIKALHEGADGYLTHHFTLRELQAVFLLQLS